MEEEKLTKEQIYWRSLSPEKRKEISKRSHERYKMRKEGMLPEVGGPIDHHLEVDYSNEWFEQLKLPKIGCAIIITEMWVNSSDKGKEHNATTLDGSREPIMVSVFGSEYMVKATFLEYKKHDSFIHHLLPRSDNYYICTIYELSKKAPMPVDENHRRKKWDEEYFRFVFKMQ